MYPYSMLVLPKVNIGFCLEIHESNYSGIEDFL